MMVRFGVQTVGESMKLGQDAAEMISAEFLHPIKLEFEKVCYTFRFMHNFNMPIWHTCTHTNPGLFSISSHQQEEVNLFKICAPILTLHILNPPFQVCRTLFFQT